MDMLIFIMIYYAVVMVCIPRRGHLFWPSPWATAHLEEAGHAQVDQLGRGQASGHDPSDWDIRLRRGSARVRLPQGTPKKTTDFGERKCKSRKT